MEQEGDSYLSKEAANRFLQCVLTCWQQVNNKTGISKDSKLTKADKNCSRSRLIEFCCNLSSKNDKKKKDRKKREKCKSRNNLEGCGTQCQVCRPAECSEGDGHASKKNPIKGMEKSKKEKEWKAECQKLFREFHDYKKKKSNKPKATTSTGIDPDPCYEVYRDLGAMSQEPCSNYFNSRHDPYESWGQQEAHWANFWGKEYPCSPQWNQTWSSQGAPYGEGLGANYTRSWSNPQTVTNPPGDCSSPPSSTSSQTNLRKTSSDDMDTSMLLAIARAAINLSMEHQKGESALQKGKRNNLSDDDDDDESFCDMLESIFSQC